MISVNNLVSGAVSFLKNLVPTVFGSLIILIWIIVSGYISIASTVIIEAIEKVRIVEDRIEKNIIDLIIREGVSSEQIIEQIESELEKKWYLESEKPYQYYIRDILDPDIKGNNDLRIRNLIDEKFTSEDKGSIENLDHVIWYYRYSGIYWVTFLVWTPYFALIFLGIGSAGCLGSTVRMIYNHINGTIPIGNSKFFAHPALGFFIGIMVLSISFVIPNIFVQGGGEINMTSTILIGFFAGIFSEQFFSGIKNLAVNLISKVPQDPKK